ncbi:MAG: hypothetical protein EOP21_10440, partial [Hyphomicrobiales bacterium]
MFVSPRYLDRYKLKFANETDLLAVAPVELPLHGFEQVGTSSVGLDAPISGEFPEAIGILYQDSNPDDAESWELEQSKRRTFITIPDHPIGYMFDGLLAPADAKTWFRNRFAIPEPE